MDLIHLLDHAPLALQVAQEQAHPIVQLTTDACQFTTDSLESAVAFLATVYGKISPEKLVDILTKINPENALPMKEFVAACFGTAI